MPNAAWLRERAHELIPAGCHTYSKGDDQFPSNAPAFIVRARDAKCWDTEGNEFVDWGMGLRSVILGHAYAAVLEAVRGELERGSNFSRPAPIETELAETLTELIPSAEMVKFGKNGSDVTSAAVRLARAYTGRSYVARCRQHPFFSVHDWFIGSTAMPEGIPDAVRQLTLQFDYNQLETLDALFARHPNEIACVILEPVTSEPPVPGFLEGVRELTARHGCVLVFDEIITGFRWHLGGAQTYFGVTPDLSCFAKAIGNGFSVSALVGRRDIMRLGGLQHPRPRVFLLSATHGGETHALAAAIATIRELRERDAIARIWKTGELLQEGFTALAAECGVGQYVAMQGYPCNPHLVTFDHDGQPSLEYRTLFLQETVADGILMPWISVSFAHGPAEIDRTLQASRRAMALYARALDRRDARPFLAGPVVKPVFRTYN